MSAPSISVVVVSYNRRDQVKSLLESVYRGDLVPHEIIVVDNASRDGTVEMLARDFPDVRVIANRENYMGSHAVNQGIAAAAGEFVYATADDNVVDEHCLSGAARRDGSSFPDAGLVAPVMYFYDEPGRVWFAGCDVSMLTGLTRFFTDMPREASVETACAPNCYMVRRSVLRVDRRPGRRSLSRSITKKPTGRFAQRPSVLRVTSRATRASGTRRRFQSGARSSVPAIFRSTTRSARTFTRDRARCWHGGTRAAAQRAAFFAAFFPLDGRRVRRDLRLREPRAPANLVGVFPRCVCRRHDALTGARPHRLVTD